MKRPAMRAITTRYKGYSFRSRLEARWAVFFDHLKIRWEYEPEGFELGNGLRYLPDFWLPDVGIWVEVKPDAPDDAAREKAWRLVQKSKRLLFMTNGMPDNFGSIFATCQGDWLHQHEFRATILWQLPRPMLVIEDPKHDAKSVELDMTICDQDLMPFYLGPNPKGGPHPAIWPGAQPALESARGSRFEFGEKGGAA